ncbi:MAG: peptidylprolyl isomerase [Clostridiales bacterium]|nr:peptidylprolyl isomerase [Clostridiales bacterium]
MRRLISLLLVFSFVLSLAGCSSTSETSAANEHVYMEMKIKDYGVLEMELYPEKAPITVQNFVDLVKNGFYDGLLINRVQPGFVIQGGNPLLLGRPGVDSIKGEFSENGVNNDLHHTRGALSMARSAENDSASSQFFICVADCRSSLDGKYACFGYVTKGMDVVDRIVGICPGQMDKGFIENQESMPVIEYIKLTEGKV